MAWILKYRVGAILLISAFVIFNVGLPLAAAACPMGCKQSKGFSCCAVKNDFSKGKTSLSRLSPSCCTKSTSTVNKTEFIQTKLGGEDYSKYVTAAEIISFSHFSQTESFYQSHLAPTPPCPGSDIIPLFNSSLLI